MKNKYLLGIIVLLWIVVLAGIYTYYNRIKQTGQVIILKTEPIDPRDPFKGDYINLQYDMSSIRYPLSEAEKTELMRTNKIYAVLKPESHYWVLDHFSTQKPVPGTTYIQGWVWGEIRDFMRIQYNIESYYVKEGKGKEIEAHLGKDLYVEVFVDKNGLASVKALLLGTKPYPF